MSQEMKKPTDRVEDDRMVARNFGHSHISPNFKLQSGSNYKNNYQVDCGQPVMKWDLHNYINIKQVYDITVLRMASEFITMLIKST